MRKTPTVRLDNPLAQRTVTRGDDAKTSQTTSREAAARSIQDAAGNRPMANLIEGSGRPLDAGTRAEMQERFSANFSGVRIHTDGAASDAVTAAGARGVTSGSDVAFARGFFDPETSTCRTLLAPELAHVVQQRRGADSTRDAAEVDARHAATQIAGGQNAAVAATGSGGAQADEMTDKERLQALAESVQGTVQADPNRSGELVVVDPEAFIHRADDPTPAAAEADATIEDLGSTRGGGGGTGEQMFTAAKDAGVDINHSENGSVWEAVRRSKLAEGIGGLASGIGLSSVPGGFLVSPVGQATGALPKPTRVLEFFEGIGETFTGAVQTLAGIGGEAVGTEADVIGVAGAPETFGGSLALTAAGVTLNVASWRLLAHGAANVATGIGTSAHALIRSADDEGPDATHDPEFERSSSGASQWEGSSLNVDGPHAVGEEGITEQESMRRAMDLHDRQLVESMTNQATKGSRVEVPSPTRTVGPLPPVSVVGDPAALIYRPTLKGVKEWDQLADIILQEKQSSLVGKSPKQVKEILSRAVREEIKNPTTEPRNAISDALKKLFPDTPLEPVIQEAKAAPDNLVTHARLHR